MARCGLRASRPSEPALSKPTKAKIARTTPTRTPPGTTPRSVTWSTWKGLPRWIQMAAQSTRMIAIARDSSTRLVRAERPMSMIATNTVSAKSTTNSRPSSHGLLAGRPKWDRKSAPKMPKPRTVAMPVAT